MVVPELSWMKVDDHRLSALTLPGIEELKNKEHGFASLKAREITILRGFAFLAPPHVSRASPCAMHTA